MLSCATALKEIKSKYSDLPLKTRAGKTVKLRNLLMLDDDGLKAATAVLRSFADTKDSDVAELMPKMRDLLLLIGDDRDALLSELEDWPLGMYQHVIEEWQGATEMGEASDSAS